MNAAFRYLYVLAVLLPALDAAAQAQPRYRLRTLEYEKKYEGSLQEYKKNSYDYYGNRSSVLNWAELNAALGREVVYSLLYDEMTAERKEPTSPVVELEYQGRQTFDNNERIFTRSQTFASNNTTLTDTIQYNAQGQVSNYVLEESMNLSRKKTYYYSTGNRLDSVADYFTGLQKYYSQTHYSYDPSGLLIKKSHISLSPSPYVVVFDEHYSYNTKGLLAETIYLKSASLQSPYPLDTIQATTYQYNDSGDVIKQTRRLMDVNHGTYTFSYITFYTYDTHRKLLQQLLMAGDGNGLAFDTSSLTDYSYNAFDLPYIATTQTWGTAFYPWAGVFDSVYKVRTVEKITAVYEHIWPTAVAIPDANATEFTIYPVPSPGAIIVSARFDEPRSFNVVITNIYGSKVRSWNVHDTQTYHHILQLQDLPAGEYIISLEGNKEKISKRFSLLPGR